MDPRETEYNAYAKFWGDKQGVLWYVMVFSGVVNTLVLGPKRTQRITEMRFEFPFNLIDKLAKAFVTGQSGRILKCWYICVGPEQGIRRCYADGLNQQFSFVCSVGFMIC